MADDSKRSIDQLTAAAADLETFKTSLWTGVIEQLGVKEVRQIAEEGKYLKPLERLRKAMVHTQERFIGRVRAIETMVACVLARANVVFLGPPGTAKSLIVRTFADALGIRPATVPIAEEEEIVRGLREKKKGEYSGESHRELFEYLLTRYTNPEELFGSSIIQILLDHGIFVRSTRGMLPQAEIVFLDEIFKGNSAILNALLSIFNERIFYNMGQAFTVNVVFAIGASNAPPDPEELGALYDRFPFRVVCRPVGDDHIEDLIEHAHRFNLEGLASGSTPGSSPGTSTRQQVVCLNDVRLLSKVVRAGVFGGDGAFGDNNAFKKSFLQIFRAARNDWAVSDRTALPLLMVSRALALLEKEEPAQKLEPRHLRCFGHVAPSPDQTPDVQRWLAESIRNMGESEMGLFDDL